MSLCKFLFVCGCVPLVFSMCWVIIADSRPDLGTVLVEVIEMLRLIQRIGNYYWELAYCRQRKFHMSQIDSSHTVYSINTLRRILCYL